MVDDSLDLFCMEVVGQCRVWGCSIDPIICIVVGDGLSRGLCVQFVDW